LEIRLLLDREPGPPRTAKKVVDLAPVGDTIDAVRLREASERTEIYLLGQ
jgi:hypothetical protein